jgi:DNA polymerase
MTQAHGDFETRSELDLREVGLHRYARHPSTEPWCLAWALDEDEPRVWVPGTPPPEPLLKHVASGGDFYAHNAPFELEIWNEILVKRYGFPVLRPEQTHCTMAMAYAMALPGALEDAALALGLPMLKDTTGRALMLKYARPWKTHYLREIDAHGEQVVAVQWMNECPEFTLGGRKWTGAEGLGRLMAYCQQDVRVERELHKRLVPLSDTERRVWLLDYKINQRGVAVDVDTARAAVAMAETVKEKCNVELARVTNNAVTAVTAVAALKNWLAGQGVPVDGLAKQDVIDLLATDTLPEIVRKALVLRQEAGKASTAKFDVMLKRVGEDGRLRQLYQYHGAATGRWAGRGVQVHNLVREQPRPEVVEKILALVRAGDHEAIDLLYGPPLTMLSQCLRSFFVAPAGKVLVSGDWGNIEGRGQAWFAGEDWKLDAFRAADAKTGPGIYELAYSRMFGVPVESIGEKSHERQVGKVCELAFGYQGGVGSFHVMAKNYGVKVADAQADEFKTAWRAAHPKIVAAWKSIQQAAINAVRSPGETYTCGHPGRQAKFKMAGSFLWCLLPSGRVLCYPYAKLLEGEYGPQLTYMAAPSADEKRKNKVIYDPQNSANWARVGTYGGALFNNIIQGTCRDFESQCMLRLDEKGATLTLHTHDSISLESDRPETARPAMEAEMRVVPPWAAGFPLYMKECDVGARFRG